MQMAVTVNKNKKKKHDDQAGEGESAKDTSE